MCEMKDVLAIRNARTCSTPLDALCLLCTIGISAMKDKEMPLNSIWNWWKQACLKSKDNLCRFNI